MTALTNMMASNRIKYMTIYDATATLISPGRSPEIHKTLGWQPSETEMQGTKQEAAYNRYQLVEEKSSSMERPQP
jgi:hypothetical protein